MKNSNKIFNKIRCIIYNQREGILTEEEAWGMIKGVMDIHNLHSYTNQKTHTRVQLGLISHLKYREKRVKCA